MTVRLAYDAAIENASRQQLLDLLEAREGRTLTVPFSRALERRVRAHITHLNRELERLEQEPVLADSDGDVAVVLLALAERGLESNERSRGVWTGVSGREYPLPRTRRLRRRARLRVVWQDAITHWRAL